MDSNGVIDAKNINWSLLKVSELRETQHGSQIAFMNYNDPNSNNGRLRVRLGKMRAPFGASALENDRHELRYSVNLSFTGLGADDPVLGETFQFCEKWDNYLREEAKKKSKEWLNKRTVSDDTIEDKYFPMLIYPRDKKTKEIIRTYPPRIKIILDKKKEDEVFDTKIYMKEKGRFPVPFDVHNFSDTIQKGDYVRPIIELKSMWFSVMGFGCKWRLFQGRVYKDNRSILTDVTGGSSDEEDISDYERERRSVFSPKNGDGDDAMESAGYNIIKVDDVEESHL